MDGAGEQVADGVHRLHGELRGGLVVHQDLERHGDQGPGGCGGLAARRALGGVRRLAVAVPVVPPALVARGSSGDVHCSS